MRLERLRAWILRLDPYGYGHLVGGGSVFPKTNAHLVHLPAGIALNGALFNAWEPISLAEGVILGHEVMFLTGRHEMGPDGVVPDPSSEGGITVEDGAWIASRALILGGVTIGAASIIGAGAVVTEPVPPGEFWAGNPARHVRTLSDDS
jgi:maltose O-acetyltransferase